MWYMFSSSLHWLIIGNQYKMGKAFYCVTGLVCFLLTEEYHFKHNINQYKQSVPQTGLSLQCDCPVTSGTVCFRRSVVTVTQTPLWRKLLFWVQEWTVCDLQQTHWKQTRLTHIQHTAVKTGFYIYHMKNCAWVYVMIFHPLRSVWSATIRYRLSQSNCTVFSMLCLLFYSP